MKLFPCIVISCLLLSLGNGWSASSLLPKDFGSPLSSVSPEVWLAEAEKNLTPTNAALIQRAQKTLLGNVMQPAAWRPWHGIMPALAAYRGVWNWDSAFHAVGVSHWDAKLAREQFELLFSRQGTNGMLPDVIWENGDTVTSLTKPPVMAWAVAVVDRRHPDTGFLRGIYPKLVKLGEFWMKERGGESDGLFYYAGSNVGCDSGWDNSIRFDNGYCLAKADGPRLWAIDLNCYMVMHYRALAYIAERLQLSKEKKMWLQKADELAQRINETLWDEQLGFYVDRDRLTGKTGAALSPAGFMPLFAHIAPAKRAARVVKFAADPKKFFPGMPTAAYDTLGFNGRDVWRGPAWLNTSFFAIKGLQDYGCTNLAEAMRSTLLGWVANNSSSIREYYEPKTGEGLGAMDFGWSSVFTVAFILNWENDNLTWFFPKSPKLSSTAVFSPRFPVCNNVFMKDSLTYGANLIDQATQETSVQCRQSLVRRFNVTVNLSNQGHCGATTENSLPSTNQTSDFQLAITAANSLQSEQPGQSVFSITLGADDSAQPTAERATFAVPKLTQSDTFDT